MRPILFLLFLAAMPTAAVANSSGLTEWVSKSFKRPMEKCRVDDDGRILIPPNGRTQKASQPYGLARTDFLVNEWWKPAISPELNSPKKVAFWNIWDFTNITPGTNRSDVAKCTYKNRTLVCGKMEFLQFWEDDLRIQDKKGDWILTKKVGQTEKHFCTKNLINGEKFIHAKLVLEYYTVNRTKNKFLFVTGRTTLWRKRSAPSF